MKNEKKSTSSDGSGIYWIPVLENFGTFFYDKTMVSLVFYQSEP